METIRDQDAQDRFSELIERAEKGERFTITRGGKPVAELVPIASKAHDPERVQEGFRRLRELSQRLNLDLTWEELKAMRDEGKR